MLRRSAEYSLQRGTTQPGSAPSAHLGTSSCGFYVGMRIIAIISGLLRLFTFPFAMSRPSVPKKGWLAYYSEWVGIWAKGNFLPHDTENAVQDSVEGLLGDEHVAAIDQKAHLYRAAQNYLTSESRRQACPEVLPLHELTNDEHLLQHDPGMALRAMELMQAFCAALLELLLKCKQVFLWNKTEWLYLGRNRAQYEMLWWVLSPGQGS